MLQLARQAQLIELVFEPFSDFTQTAAAITRTGMGEHQMTDRTKMCGSDERRETAGLFG